MARKQTTSNVVSPANWAEDAWPGQMQKLGNMLIDRMAPGQRLPRNPVREGKDFGYCQRGPVAAMIDWLEKHPDAKVTCAGWKVPAKPTTAAPETSLEDRIANMSADQKAAILALLMADEPAAPTAESIRQGRGGRVKVGK